MADGLASNEILGILEDRSANLWLMTNEGLSRFSPQTGQFRNYDVSDGLQGREFQGGACYQNQSGEMFFGGTNGFNAFYPQDIFDNLYTPPVRITSFKVLNQEVKLPMPIWKTAEIELSPKEYLFSLEFRFPGLRGAGKEPLSLQARGIDRRLDLYRRQAPIGLIFPPASRQIRLPREEFEQRRHLEQTAASLVIRMHGPWWRSWWLLS